MIKNSIKKAFKFFKYLVVIFTIGYWIYIVIDDWIFIEKYWDENWLLYLGIWFLYYFVFLLFASIYYWVIALVAIFTYHKIIKRNSNEDNKKTELREYWKSLNFEYLKTYSGLRGEKFEKLIEENELKIEQLKEELKTARYMQQPKINAKIQELQNEIYSSNARIIDIHGNLHDSTVEISTKKSTNDFVKILAKTLLQKPKNEFALACAPVFRDAIVFYSDKDKIIGILQICFSCVAIENENKERLRTDLHTFSKLEILLKEVGHPIKKDAHW